MMTYTEWVESLRRASFERGFDEGFKRGLEESLEESLEEGRALGWDVSRVIVVRQALRRFGAQTAVKLARMVEPMSLEQVDRVSDAVVECDTGDELLVRAANGAWLPTSSQA